MYWSCILVVLVGVFKFLILSPINIFCLAKANNGRIEPTCFSITMISSPDVLIEIFEIRWVNLNFLHRVQEIL